MPGLGYLPESTEAVLAVQMQPFLERVGPDAGADPVSALTGLGLPRSAAEILDAASAVRLRNVDQLVVGLGFQEHALPPQVTLVVHTRQPFDLEEIARREKARPLHRGSRTLYVAKAAPLPEVYWWQAGDRVLVATVLAKDFDSVPAEPRAGIDHLPAAVTPLVREFVAEDAAAWFVAASDRWDRYLRPYTDLPLTPLQGRQDLLPPAERLRTVAVFASVRPGMPIGLRVTTKSDEAGADLRAVLAERVRGEPIEVVGSENWVRLQIPNEPSRLGSVVSRLLGEREKK